MSRSGTLTARWCPHSASSPCISIARSSRVAVCERSRENCASSGRRYSLRDSSCRAAAASIPRSPFRPRFERARRPSSPRPIAQDIAGRGRARPDAGHTPGHDVDLPSPFNSCIGVFPGDAEQATSELGLRGLIREMTGRGRIPSPFIILFVASGALVQPPGTTSRSPGVLVFPELRRPRPARSERRATRSTTASCGWSSKTRRINKPSSKAWRIRAVVGSKKIEALCASVVHDAPATPLSATRPGTRR